MHFSIVKNYALDKTSFLYPKIDNFLNEEYGQYSIQEFPILNYISSFFFKKYPYFLKLINIILLYIGSCFLVFWAKQYLDDYFGAIVVATNFLTIPIVFYYGWSYITDISALSFGIISVYLLELNKHNEKQYLLILSFISLTLCGLLRLPVLILPIAYHITELLYRFSLNKLFCLLISFTIIGLWYTHFLVSNQYYVQLPKEISIFAANKDEMSIVLKEWDRLMKYQLGYIQSSSLYYLIIIVLAIIYKHIFTKEFITKVALVALFSITYLILWF
ncbi:MAG: hypothetical protein KatS3mg025_0116 [Bacteroidia bacterium]|nr:MAG: hypothetical protein KatS3mg025_0116 [Bacteroidia bacterium]